MPDYTFYTQGTPNGTKVGIIVQELGISFENRLMDLSKGEQKEDWYLKINPNGRIPAMIDHTAEDFAVFETGAIMMYLAEKHGKFLPTDPKARSLVVQWLMWQMGGQGPMQGQANHFVSMAKEDVPYAKNRYFSEVTRLYTVLNGALEGKDYIAGEYSIADMALWGWAYFAPFGAIDLDDFPNVKAWYDRILERDAVKRALASPQVFSPAVPWVDDAKRKEDTATAKAKLPQA